MHYHVRTTTRRALGTYDDLLIAADAASKIAQSARAYQCTCHMGEYVLDALAERQTRSTNR